MSLTVNINRHPHPININVKPAIKPDPSFYSSPVEVMAFQIQLDSLDLAPACNPGSDEGHRAGQAQGSASSRVLTPGLTFRPLHTGVGNR